MDIVIVVLLSVAAPLATFGIVWLGDKLGDLILHRVKNEQLRRLLLRLDDMVLTVVKELHQTVVADLKAASADGRIDREERRRIKETAVRQVKTYLGAQGLEDLASSLGVWDMAVDDLIGSKIEATVHDLKTSAAAMAEPPPAPVKVAP